MLHADPLLGAPPCARAAGANPLLLHLPSLMSILGHVCRSLDVVERISAALSVLLQGALWYTAFSTTHYRCSQADGLWLLKKVKN